MGAHTPIIQRLQVLDSDNPTLILGRGFMGKFKEVAFDFEKGRIKLGNDWEPIQTAVSGSTSLARAEVSNEIEEVARGEISEAELIDKSLSKRESNEIRNLLAEWTRCALTAYADLQNLPGQVM